jgi:Na+/H+ antiporter NhaC
MLKEFKYLLFLIVIVLFFFLSFKYYFSNENKKNSYRSLKNISDKTENYSRNLILLKSDTDNIVEYVEKSIDKNKKNYNFWKLINNDG